MAMLTELSSEELLEMRKELYKTYRGFRVQDLHLDMSRGKPSLDQLDLSVGMMDVLSSDSDLSCEDGADCRNYGVLGGIPEARELLGTMTEVHGENIIIFGNSSLNVMYDTISRSFTHGVMGNTPWCKQRHVKFLCPVPGYDRHFAITDYFGIEMINIPMNDEGPDMDLVEKLVSMDEAIKGIWCVPKYSNPTGCTYSDNTVRRFAHLKPAAKDFRIYWDNAYCVHHLDFDHPDILLEILDECRKAGNPDLAYKFISTSKISFPGSGVAAIATSANNMVDIKEQLKMQTIGHDKINQLRHVRYYKDRAGILEHMKKHAEILKPKFDMVVNTLEEGLGGLGIASWTNPKGGYFVSFDSMDGCAKKIVSRMKKSGVTMTPAGATYPYGKDPHDSNIRIAPSFPPLGDIKKAMDIFVVCVKLTSIDKILEQRGVAIKK